MKNKNTKLQLNYSRETKLRALSLIIKEMLLLTPATISLLILAIVVIFLLKNVSLSFVGIFIPVVLYLTGVIEDKDAFATLAHPIIILVSCVFIMSKAIFEVGLAKLIGEKFSSITTKYGQKSDRMAVLLIMAFGAAMSTVLPNLATTATLIPIVIAIASYTRISRSKLLMSLAMGTGLGGMITLIGTPPNLLAKGALESSGLGSFGFFEFAWVGLPLTVIGILYLVTIGFKTLPNTYVEGSEEENTIEESKQSRDEKGMKKKQFITGVVFTVFVFAIILEQWTGIPGHYIGLIGVVVLVLAKVLSEKQIFTSIDWATTLFIVGILTLANALVSSGASEMIAKGATSLLGDSPSPYYLTAFLFILSAILTQFLSNTGTAGMLFPIGISIAQALGADPRSVVMAIAMGCSCSFATPMATPSNIMVMNPGKLSFVDFIKVGAPMIIIGLIISVLVLPIVYPFFP